MYNNYTCTKQQYECGNCSVVYFSVQKEFTKTEMHAARKEKWEKLWHCAGCESPPSPLYSPSPSLPPSFSLPSSFSPTLITVFIHLSTPSKCSWHYNTYAHTYVHVHTHTDLSKRTKGVGRLLADWLLRPCTRLWLLLWKILRSLIKIF